MRVCRSLASRTPEDLARNLSDELCAVIDFDVLDIVVYEDDRCEVLWQAVGTGQPVLSGCAEEDSSTWWVYSQQQVLTIADWDRDERFANTRKLLRDRGILIRSLCRLPLSTPRCRLGVFGIASLRPRVYSGEEIRFLKLLTEGLALAIENALGSEALRRTQFELQQKNSRLKLLLDLTNRLTSNLDFRELLRAICTSVREVMDCDGVGVAPLDPETGECRVRALDFPKGKGFLQEEMLVRSSGGPFATVLATLKPVMVSKSDPADASHASPLLSREEGFDTFYLVPLLHRGRVLGVLGLGRLQNSPFSAEDMAFLTEVSGQVAIAVENAFAYGEISRLKEKLAEEKLYLEQEIRTEMNFEHVVGDSPALKRVLNLVETVAPSDSTVLLLGETGTGKELFARAIHENSLRKHRTFVKLNCAAIPTGLLESELFGHEKGAFTGAISQKVGRLELADEGTLFLDEVGDIPPEIQPKLLRVLQEREFERLGSTFTRKVNVRLVAATNRDLEKMIAENEFRRDLYYRLNVFPIRIPPLRERREDIPMLVRYFVQKLARKSHKEIEIIRAADMKRLVNWDWPGNIRELENFLERAVILTRGRSLEIPASEFSRPSPGKTAVPSAQDKNEIARIVRETISQLTNGSARRTAQRHDEKLREKILRTLRETKGRVGGAAGAAARLALCRTTLISRMKKLGIDSRQFR